MANADDISDTVEATVMELLGLLDALTVEHMHANELDERRDMAKPQSTPMSQQMCASVTALRAFASLTIAEWVGWHEVMA